MNQPDTRSHQPDQAGQSLHDDPTGAGRPPEKDLKVRRVSEDMLDDAVEATFPASDPVALTSTKTVPHQP